MYFCQLCHFVYLHLINQAIEFVTRLTRSSKKARLHLPGMEAIFAHFFCTCSISTIQISGRRHTLIFFEKKIAAIIFQCFALFCCERLRYLFLLFSKTEKERLLSALLLLVLGRIVYKTISVLRNFRKSKKTCRRKEDNNLLRRNSNTAILPQLNRYFFLS